MDDRGADVGQRGGLIAAPVDATVGVRVYLDGVKNLLAVGSRLEPADWDRPSACAGWTCRDVAGHVLCVVRWHHDWLDTALGGVGGPPMWVAKELADRNQRALESLEITDGPSRLAAFDVSAHRYADRLASSWGTPYLFPGGRVSAGLHALLAAGEWHLHAWDLGETTQSCPAPLVSVVRDAWVLLGRDISADADPWTALMQASGRI